MVEQYTYLPWLTKLKFLNTWWASYNTYVSNIASAFKRKSLSKLWLCFIVWAEIRFVSIFCFNYYVDTVMIISELLTCHSRNYQIVPAWPITFPKGLGMGIYLYFLQLRRYMDWEVTDFAIHKMGGNSPMTRHGMHCVNRIWGGISTWTSKSLSNIKCRPTIICPMILTFADLTHRYACSEKRNSKFKKHKFTNFLKMWLH